MSHKPLPEEERQEVSRIVYEYVQRARDEENAYHGVYVEKVHKLVTIHIVLFASMSYALGQLDWVRSVQSSWTAIIWVLAAGGAAGLLVAFVSGLRILSIAKVSVVGLTNLQSLVKGGQITEYGLVKT